MHVQIRIVFEILKTICIWNLYLMLEEEEEEYMISSKFIKDAFC